MAYIKRIGRLCDSGCAAYNDYVYRYSIGTGTMEWVDPAGYDVNHNSSSPSISADGRYVAFASTSNALVGNDTNGVQDIFRRDVSNNLTARVSLNTSNVQANAVSADPSISGDGQRVVFESSATNLDCCGVSDSNNGTDVVHEDMSTGKSVNLTIYDNGDKWAPSLADNGHIAFVTNSTSMDGYDGNGANDIYEGFVSPSVNSQGCCVRVSYDYAEYEELNGPSRTPAISPDGRYAAFATDATNLVRSHDADLNGGSDVAVHVFREDYSHCLAVDAPQSFPPLLLGPAATAVFAAYLAAGYTEDAAYESTLSTLRDDSLEQRCHREADEKAEFSSTAAYYACLASGLSEEQCVAEREEEYRVAYIDFYEECLKRERGLQ